MSPVLGLETSCDETSAAVVERDGRIRGHVVASQHDLHARYGGVVPELASRAHLERVGPMLEQALAEAETDFDEIELVAVGHRPGLVGSLLVGVSAAKAVAWALQRPLIGVDHVAAHVYAPALSEGADAPSPLPTPALGLVISGGHTTLFDVRGPDQRVPLGRSVDDAVGEAFDKAAAILGLGHPGGPAIERAAREGRADAVAPLPRTLLGRESLDFSFSGLKTALLYRVRGQPVGRGRHARFPHSAEELAPQTRADLAAAFQDAALETVCNKLARALDQLTRAGNPPRALVLGGGVVANENLRQRVTALAEAHDLLLRLPPLRLCLDNAAMIAGLGAWLYSARGEGDALDLPAIPTATRATRGPP